MTTNTSLEERMAAVESAIAELQKQITNPQPTNWLQQITGSFKDEPAFEEVLAYGQAIRQEDEPLMLLPNNTDIKPTVQSSVVDILDAAWNDE